MRPKDNLPRRRCRSPASESRHARHSSPWPSALWPGPGRCCGRNSVGLGRRSERKYRCRRTRPPTAGWLAGSAEIRVGHRHRCDRCLPTVSVLPPMVIDDQNRKMTDQKAQPVREHLIQSDISVRTVKLITPRLTPGASWIPRNDLVGPVPAGACGARLSDHRPLQPDTHSRPPSPQGCGLTASQSTKTGSCSGGPASATLSMIEALAASWDKITTRRLPASGSSHHQTSPRAGRAITRQLQLAGRSFHLLWVMHTDAQEWDSASIEVPRAERRQT